MKNFNKGAQLGSVHVRFYWDIQRFKNACLSGSASRKTKRSFKRIAARATRRYIRLLAKEEISEFF